MTRRDFLILSSIGISATALGEASPETDSGLRSCPITVFSKIYQELKLSYVEAAKLTARAGLDGIDCPVRPGGEVDPAKVQDQLPQYAEALRSERVSLRLLTTGITSIASPHAENIIRTGKRLGVQYYRLGSPTRAKGAALPDSALRELQRQLRDLAAMNREIGATALVQNHSPSGRSTYLGGDLTELARLVEPFNPAEVGIAFDIGHALIVHQDGWAEHFERLKSHIRVVYIKDARKQGSFVPFGTGDIGATDYFSHLKALNYKAPISLHIEFDWAHGKQRTADTLVQALKESRQVLQQWLARA